MTIEERLAAKKKALNEKKNDLKKVVKESRAVASDDSATADQLQEAAAAVTQAEKDVQALEADVQNLQKIIGNGTDTEEQNDNSDDTNPDDLPPNEEDSKRDNQLKTEKRYGLNVIKQDKEKSTTIWSGKNQVDKEKQEKRTRNFMLYVRSKGEYRADPSTTADGFKTSDGTVVIPEQILSLYQMPKNPADLSRYVNKIPVNNPTGRLPVVPRTIDTFPVTDELQENVILTRVINKVDYALRTFRGMIPVSEEMLDNGATINVGSFISQGIQDIRWNTEQAGIASVLKQAAAAPAKSIDDLKDIFNKQIPVGYNKSFIMTQSAYGELDKVKDSNGRYLLQDSITAASGKQILGAPVVVVDDNLLQAVGSDGKPTGSAELIFVGDPKAFVLEPYKADMSVDWVRNENYERLFMGVFRADFKKAIDEAGKFVTLDLSSTSGS